MKTYNYRILTAIFAVFMLSACAGPRDLFVVLPSDDGTVGSIEINDGQKKVVLDKAFAATTTGDDPAKVFKIDQKAVEKTFGDALSAQPNAPKSFSLYFLSNSTKLTKASLNVFKNIYDDINRRKAPEIFVIGHSDSVGKIEVNDRLSLKRANAVIEVLVLKGIKRELMQAAGRGERELLVTTGDGVSEAKNRRVEINVR
jgi:outer membrane protein OmpA-like peptidoglycan-associated protein